MEKEVKENTTTENSDVNEKKESTSIDSTLNISDYNLVIASNGSSTRVYMNGIEQNALVEINFNHKIKECAEIKITQLVLPKK